MQWWNSEFKLERLFRIVLACQDGKQLQAILLDPIDGIRDYFESIIDSAILSSSEYSLAISLSSFLACKDNYPMICSHIYKHDCATLIHNRIFFLEINKRLGFDEGFGRSLISSHSFFSARVVGFSKSITVLDDQIDLSKAFNTHNPITLFTEIKAIVVAVLDYLERTSITNTEIVDMIGRVLSHAETNQLKLQSYLEEADQYGIKEKNIWSSGLLASILEVSSESILTCRLELERSNIRVSSSRFNH